jgi:hypothetical protein
MWIRKLCLILLAAFICGCSDDHLTAGRGDVGQFILKQAIIRGGSPVTTNSLPAIATRWRYSTDKYGVVIRMPRKAYPSVEKFLRQAFGKPGLGPKDTIDGGKLGEYRLTSKGGGIQFGYSRNEAWVIVMRPLSEREFDEDFMPRAAKAMSESR